MQFQDKLDPWCRMNSEQMPQERVALNSGSCSPSLELPPPYQVSFSLLRWKLWEALLCFCVLQSPHCWSLHRREKKPLGSQGGTKKPMTLGRPRS